MRNLRRTFVDILRFLIGISYILLGKPLLNKRPMVFVFHEVSHTPSRHAQDTNTYCSPDLFQRQILWIKSAFRVANLRHLDQPLTSGMAVVSFDDGYLGVLENALPVLESWNIPAICLLNMSVIEGEINSSALAMYVAKKNLVKCNWENSNPRFYAEAMAVLTIEEKIDLRHYQGPYLNRKALEELASSDLISIGDHLDNHWFIDSLFPNEIESSLQRNLDHLRDFSAYRKYFASPHAVANSSAISRIIESGYDSIFSGSRQEVLDGVHIYPRVDMNLFITSKVTFYGVIALSLLRSGR